MSWFTVSRDFVVKGFKPFAASVDAQASAAGTATTSTVVSDIKQAGSDLLSVTKTGVDVGIDTATAKVEDAIDGLILKVTGGAGVLIIPAEHALVGILAGILKGAIDSRILAAQAAGAAKPAVQVAPAPAPMIVQG